MATNLVSFLFKLLHSQFFITPATPIESFLGKTVIITGSNGGLGLEAARHIARLDVTTIILAVRDISKGEAAKREIVESTSCSLAKIQVWDLDLSSYASVIAFAERVAKLPRLDIVLANAGIHTKHFVMAEDNESTVTVNVVSTFLLGLLLLPKLKETAMTYNIRPVLTIVTSELHAVTSFPERKASDMFGELNNVQTARMFDRYMVSKLMEIFIVRQWADERPIEQYPVIINSVNPGFCLSNLSHVMQQFTLFRLWAQLVARTTEVGSRTLVNAVLAGPESHGAYITDGEIQPPAPLVLSKEGEEAQLKLWEQLKEKLEKIKPGVTANL